ncbi:MAG: peptide chain release factor N(5)-glutamine methyltransferase [Devosiaceae bacterium]
MSETFNALVRQMAACINARPHANGLREARLLVEHVSGHSTAAQIVVGEHKVPQSDREALRALVEKRESGVPLARLLGKAAFWDFEVGLNAATLIPRDDTGALVEAALALLPTDSRAQIVDLGTGSGIIPLALARERGQVSVTGIDVEPMAVHQAQANANALGFGDCGLEERISFQTGNWLAGLDGPFDMIVSNPPYIRASEMAELSDEVRAYDPELALVAGQDGLDAYRALLPQCGARLRPDGYVLLEVGHDQANAVTSLGKEAGLRPIRTQQDLSGRDRVVVLQG